jgi:hypothetical protein
VAAKHENPFVLIQGFFAVFQPFNFDKIMNIIFVQRWNIKEFRRHNPQSPIYAFRYRYDFSHIFFREGAFEVVYCYQPSFSIQMVEYSETSCEKTYSQLSGNGTQTS